MKYFMWFAAVALLCAAAAGTLAARAEAHQPKAGSCAEAPNPEGCRWWVVRHLGVHWRPMAQPNRRQTKAIICSYWRSPELCRSAWMVAWKESGLGWSALNGQYCSVFQMGSSERASYNANPCFHGGNNVRGAFTYWCGGKAAGRCRRASWGPWECKPVMDTSDGCKAVPRWVIGRP